MGKNNFRLRQIACIPIKLYRYLLSPLLKPCCRYYPSCSVYAEQAINHYGIMRGIWVACRRLASCHPWSLGGYDPINPNKENH